MSKQVYKTGEICPQDGNYKCQMSNEVQKYKKGDIFDYCKMGKATEWKRLHN